jgi:hypothetical protein
VDHWIEPTEGFIKVNWDAALDQTRKRMGIGVIGRNHLGQVLAAYCDTKPFVKDPASAEAWGAWRAVELCRTMGWRKVQLEGDALEIIQAFKRNDAHLAR